jgi:hypothetical protein
MTTLAMPADTRPRFEFKIPEKARLYPTDPKFGVMTTLRVSDELEATAIAQSKNFNPSVMKLEQLRRAVLEIDGKPIDWGAPGGAEWIERTSPPVRELLEKGFNQIHVPEEDVVKDFLASIQAVSG